ncbi:aldehyde dehydrogenase family protein [Jatrophihabitans cynanchi]|uniref:Aldehyde dehydrogenase family protein n=1 Tax=Jatrophihabitans cynanchi TaxID=2944128 RepID=A0ABY7K5T6_9ACTN|nr:aldehyde dehydrogenase family protein [Jatrophihabitans sp. SB3-54]WAX58987.1 aldehyde dehydrogenase family protein [Jatrophihabitans sp. SB3-54]
MSLARSTETSGPLSFEPRSGIAVSAPPESRRDQVEATVAAARACAAHVAARPPASRAAWLSAVADAVQERSAQLCELADAETALGVPRLTGELARAAGALRFYGAVAEEGSWLDAVIDHARDGVPDLRRVNVPLGPIAVFGASNFPFGFGVLGHDTASAIASGCPVVVKAHPAHPRLSAALGELALSTLAAAGAPSGTFGLVAGFDAGAALVTHPAVRAVGFTGSQAGGVALWKLAAGRPVPIPVFAEMGTVNTAVLTRAGAGRAAEVAAGFVDSFTLGMGQFCTKPGLLLAPAGSAMIDHVRNALATRAPSGWLLTASIARAYTTGLERLLESGARTVHACAPPADGWAAPATVLEVDIAALQAGSVLLEECFGPVALVAEYADDTELDGALHALPGSLAAAVHSGGPEDPELAGLVACLAGRTGRVVVDGWPTGVALGWAQHHGGPWPATTNSSASSVGASALTRFVRPVAYQDAPDSALPEPIRELNPWGVPRRVDGVRA